MVTYFPGADLISKVRFDHVPMIFDRIPSLFHLWSKFRSISELFQVPMSEECIFCDKMTKNPGTHFLRYRSRSLGTIVVGSGYFLRYGTKQNTVVAVCICQKYVTDVSKHCSMCKSDGAMPFSLSCQKVIHDSESAKTLC